MKKEPFVTKAQLDELIRHRFIYMTKKESVRI